MSVIFNKPSSSLINKAGLDIIKINEDLRLEAYPDPGYGWDVPTIGWGHTRNVYKGMEISRQEADLFLLEDIQEAEKCVWEAITVPLNENQYSALVSMTFNIGHNALVGSTLARKLNEGDYQGAADEMFRWNKSKGRTLNGLTDRRARERALFLKPVIDEEPDQLKLPIFQKTIIGSEPLSSNFKTIPVPEETQTTGAAADIQGEKKSLVAKHPLLFLSGLFVVTLLVLAAAFSFLSHEEMLDVQRILRNK